jgi:ferredoxin
VRTSPVIEGDAVKVSIDNERCQGHQMCAIAAPDVFGSDDIGNAVLLIDGSDVPEALLAKTRRAAGNCPEHAILIED